MGKPEIPSDCIFSKCTIHLWDPTWPLINNARYLSLSRWSQETSKSPVRPVAPRPGLSRQPTLLNTFYNTIDMMHYQNRQRINSVDISKKQIEFYIFNNICVTIYNQWKSQVPYTSDAWVGKKLIHVVIHGRTMCKLTYTTLASIVATYIKSFVEGSCSEFLTCFYLIQPWNYSFSINIRGRKWEHLDGKLI